MIVRGVFLLRKYAALVITMTLLLVAFGLGGAMKIPTSPVTAVEGREDDLHELRLLREGRLGKELLLYAKSAVLMDADTNRILYGKNQEKEMPMASTTKIMTCICALENGDRNAVVTTSQKAAAAPKVKLGFGVGEKYVLNDLLYSLILESHNDAAVAIAETVAGSVEAFAELMNQKARDLGCRDTYFITPNGLDATVTFDNGEQRTHHTTAVDLAKIMNYCAFQSEKKEEFLEITRAQTHSFSELSGARSFTVGNHNGALTLFPETVSGKTGFTNDAGYCYVGAFENEEGRYLISLLACGWPNNKGYKWKDCGTLLNYGKETYHREKRQITDRDLELPLIRVQNSGCFADEERMVPLTLGKTEELSVLVGENDEEKLSWWVRQSAWAPLQEGAELGMVFFQLNDGVVAAFPIKAGDSVTKPDVGSYLRRMSQLLLEMAVL